MNVDRRQFVKVSAAGVGGALLLPETLLAFNPVLFLGGLIVGEIVLGVLRAYDIDIGRTTENIVRSFRNQYPQEIRCGCNEITITRRGRSDSGCIQVSRRGVIAASHPHEREPQGYWMPGSIVFATTQQLGKPGDFREIGAGYPRGRHSKRDNTDSFIVSQEFEGGKTDVTLRRGAEYFTDAVERPYGDYVLDMKWSAARV